MTTRLAGRYTLLRELGRGGMGTVYSAYDEELDRKVAVKVLRQKASESLGGSKAMGEAQALARLSHPNVVQVHDVGVLGAQVFLAMEQVQGETLRVWQREVSRSWREVLVVYRQAGEGLAAAHAAGLIHRDFKPDNVMLGDDGRVRVMDFGLAQRRESGLGDPQEMHSELGSLVGTPAYMSPEQLRGEAVDAAADSFAFCVSLWEGLHGERPFAGGTVAELRESVGGVVRSPPVECPSPRWLREVLIRGLAPEPRRRWPSMAALLTALDRGLRRAEWRRQAVKIGALAAAFAALVAGGFGWSWAEQRARVEACAALGAQIGLVWDEATRTRLRGVLIGSGLPFAPATAERVLPRLDAWAAEWARVREETCLKEYSDKTWSEELRGRADECLDERRGGLVAVVEELAVGSREMVMGAVDVAASLAPASACGVPQELARGPALPKEGAGRLQAIRQQLRRAAALRAGGRYKDGEAQAREALGAAEALGWAPARAEARLSVGRFETTLQRNAAAKSTLMTAYFEAARASAPEVATDAAIALTGVIGSELRQREDALLWAQLAELGLLALGGTGRSPRDVALLDARGMVHVIMGEHQAGAELLRRAVEIAEEALGADHPLVAEVVSHLAIAEGQLGDLSRARDSAARALALAERMLGPEHPKVIEATAVLATRLAAYARKLDDPQAAARAYERAEALLQRILTIDARANGRESELQAETLNHLHFFRFLRGEVEGVEAGLAAAVAMHERVLGPDSTRVTYPLICLGVAQDAYGRHAEARWSHERALAIHRRLAPDGHAAIATSLNYLGVVHLHEGDLAAARRLLEEAYALRSRLFDDAHPMVAGSLRALAHLEFESGDLARGEAYLARAIKSSSLAELGEARFALALALWQRAPERRAEAREVAALARDGFVLNGKRADRLRATVETWLAEHPLP